MKKHVPNIITGSRILCSMWLLLLPVFSGSFYAVYLLCGFTDMADGILARKTNTATAFGSRLDSAADLIFLILAWIKLLPAMHLPFWLWFWIICIGILKATAMIAEFFCTKHIADKHTTLNKVTGFLLFLLPLTVFLIDLACSAAVVCTVATCCAVQELYHALFLCPRHDAKTDP